MAISDGERAERERFEELVEEALEGLPEQFAARLENVDVVVEGEPSRRTLRDMEIPAGGTLFGLYQGIPQTERTTAYGAVMPDRIIIYREPILDEADATCPKDGDFEATVRQCVPPHFSACGPLVLRKNPRDLHNSSHPAAVIASPCHATS
ncbi:MAG: metallopeptidase family protein [Planctomycetota bacterium]|nr:metallopeptidase family protein [Planctomycetota bacterium]